MITQVIGASRAGIGSVIVTATGSGKAQALSNVGIVFDPLVAIPPEPPDTGGGGGGAGGGAGSGAGSRPRRLHGLSGVRLLRHVRRKRDELDELLERLSPIERLPPGAAPILLTPSGLQPLSMLSLLDSVAMPIFLPMVATQQDDDEEAIALLLSVLF
jgi:hypothetical protein